MKKIALVIKKLRAGGGERVAATLSQELAKHNEVDIILFDNRFIDYQYGGQLIYIGQENKSGLLGKSINVIQRTAKLRRLYKENKYDCIFSFMESANYPSIIASRKTIASIHIDPDFLSKRERLLVRLLYPFAHRVAPVSSDIGRVLQDKYGLKNVTPIYNPVSIEELKYLANKPTPHPRKYILAVGRLTYQKHFDLLIESYANSKAQADCDLIILGEGELRGELEAQIKTLGLEQKVLLPGRLKDPFHYFKHAEFMALSSRAEGFPMVMIEALTLSCPVLSVDCPTGPREIIRHKENGLLIEMDNAALLTESIDSLFYDESLRATLRDNAAESVAHLSAENICKHWISVADCSSGDYPEQPVAVRSSS